jgi:hypothetical protein
MPPQPRPRALALILIAFLCVSAYAPFLGLPLFEDDYPNIAQALQFGASGGWLTPLHHPIFRLRATSYWAMLPLWRGFQLAPAAYHFASLVVHILNAWLVYVACLMWPRTRPAAIWAAAFFAVHEGHQEAVVWFSSIAELFQFLFGGAALLCWNLARTAQRVWLFQVAGVILFALALVSKESAIVFLLLFLLTTPPSEWRRSIMRLLPYAALAALAVVSLWASRTYSFRFSDGSFSLHAPFWITWPRGMARLLWIWGWVATAVIARYWRERELGAAAAIALAWMGVALMPYSFLTYSTEIPSRQTYLASAGLAALAGIALSRLAANHGRARTVAAVLAAAMLIHNVGYLWIKKRRQFIERAELTDQLIQLAKQKGGPVWVKCFPRPALIAEEALHLGAGIPTSDIEWSADEAARQPPAAVFCK